MTDQQSGIEGIDLASEADLEGVKDAIDPVAASPADDDTPGKSKPKVKRNPAKSAKVTPAQVKPNDGPTLASEPKAGKQSKVAPAPWTFPKNSLEDTLVVVRAIEEQNGGNPMKSDMLVKAVGFKTVNDWRYLELLRSANQYGVVEGSGRHATVKLTDTGQDIVAPSSPKARQNALVRAFHNVDRFSRVEQFYSGKKLPEDEFFENTLIRDFSVSRERVRAFIDIFTKNLNYLHAFRSPSGAERVGDEGQSSFSERQPFVPPADEQVEGTRTFLGSGLVDHSQKITVAARATAEKKAVGHRS